MKNLKLKVLASALAITCLIPAISASAEEANTNATRQFGSGLLKQQQNLETKSEWQQYKPTITQKKDTIKQNHSTNQALRNEIKEKRTTAKGLTKDIRQNKKKLSSDDLAKIDAALKTINSDVSSLADTKGTIKTAFTTAKDDIKNKNFQDALTQLDNVINIQNTRTDGLKKLSTDMDTLINLLQSATANSTTM
ncbi:hypothetical protein [Clostridium sp. 'White wine YQ']|uniref:hypothetical protein n=1 Tax=Clostridium sp. 'White wine YQ' TaxID=3027474 RepID=UPI00236529A6|nr:hypothetical protein [Clostridium sp. 'White wine YQ']MDD7796179.1 hypothetical protein [Clostridium sp. 'White wine YQ']